METCTVCGKELHDLKIVIRLQYQVHRKTAADTWEPVENTSLSSTEIMCKDCFDKFVDTLDESLSNRTEHNV